MNILPYGEPGVGKTVFAGTALDHPALCPVLYLDVDGGVITLRKRRDLEVVQVRTVAQIKQIHNDLYDAVDWEAEDPTLPYGTVVIDTISELAKLAMRELMVATHNNNPKQNLYVPSQREYLINGEMMREIIRAYRDLPCNVIFCCHSGDNKDNANVTTFFPQFSGKLRHEIAGFIDIVGYMTADVTSNGTERFMQVVKTKRVAAKDRTNALGDGVENPTMPAILEAIEAADKLIKPAKAA
jgi:phage nucleotide-binding protein